MTGLSECGQIEAWILDDIITRDETWAFEYDPETDCQNAEWHILAYFRQRKARMCLSENITRYFLWYCLRCLLYLCFWKLGIKVLRVRWRPLLLRCSTMIMLPVLRVRVPDKAQWANSAPIFLQDFYLQGLRPPSNETILTSLMRSKSPRDDSSKRGYRLRFLDYVPCLEKSLKKIYRCTGLG